MFYFLRTLSVPHFKILTRLPLFEIKYFLTCHNSIFTKIFFPDFGRWDANVMTLPNQLALKQITNLQNTTAWLHAEFCKNFYQKASLKDFRLDIKKVLEKSQIGWRYGTLWGTDPPSAKVSPPSHKIFYPHPVLKLFTPPPLTGNDCFCIFHTWLLPTSTCLYFWSYYNWLNAVIIDF